MGKSLGAPIHRIELFNRPAGRRPDPSSEQAIVSKRHEMREQIFRRRSQKTILSMLYHFPIRADGRANSGDTHSHIEQGFHRTFALRPEVIGHRHYAYIKLGEL